jgi:hypothetical protein
VNLRLEFLSYQWKKNADGSWSNNIPRKENDHGPDAIRYLLLAIGEDLENSWISRSKKTTEFNQKPEEKPKKIENYQDFRKKINNFDKSAPMTAGMLDMEY